MDLLTNLLGEWKELSCTSCDVIVSTYRGTIKPKEIYYILCQKCMLKESKKK